MRKIEELKHTYTHQHQPTNHYTRVRRRPNTIYSAVLVDMEAATIDHIRSGAFGKIYKPDNITTGSTGAGNTWAKGACVCHAGCGLRWRRVGPSYHLILTPLRPIIHRALHGGRGAERAGARPGPQGGRGLRVPPGYVDMRSN